MWCATCEMARELLYNPRTDAPPGEGMHERQVTSTVRNADGSSESSGDLTVYDKSDTRQIITQLAQALLGKFGSMIGARGGLVKLVRG
jgi:hypothetical protein